MSGYNVIQCECGVPAVERTVKNGPNVGKRFWTCGTRTCNFFAWNKEFNETREHHKRHNDDNDNAPSSKFFRPNSPMPPPPPSVIPKDNYPKDNSPKEPINALLTNMTLVTSRVLEIQSNMAELLSHFESIMDRMEEGDKKSQ